MNTEEQVNELMGKIEAEERRQKDLLGQIGQVFYQKYADTADGELKVLCSDIQVSQAQVLQYQQMIEELTKITNCPACGTEVVEGAVFCHKCGANLREWKAPLPTPQPVYYRPMYGSFGSAMPKSCISFVSRASHDAGIKEKYGLQRIVYPVHGCRQIGKPHMVLNGNMPKIDVNPETFEVFIDGRQAYVKPAQKFSLAQLYWFS